MRTTSRLMFLFAIAALLLASSDLTTKVAAGCAHPVSVILYPGRRCDRGTCEKSCAKEFNGGKGTCMSPNGCDCEYCARVPRLISSPRNRA
ncbi:hypothetical protein ZEAMMB73_Zm00001d018253 [Zea mays]|uniref:Uncharacterized protein n=2 Tax=Zea mays TaxID=4577 RepID=A0A1D6HLV1_MAIZE|nr:hypothetical protein ZEAMMB73_Zm00001d018253 [Zea mays]